MKSLLTLVCMKCRRNLEHHIRTYGRLTLFSKAKDMSVNVILKQGMKMITINNIITVSN